LFDGIYSRLRPSTVVVLTDSRSGVIEETRGPVRIVRRRLDIGRWGVLDPLAAFQHARVGYQIRRMAAGLPTIVHCGRAIPEGVGALMSRGFGGPRYVCWAHGEDIASAQSSRELAWLMRAVYSHSAAVLANSRNTAGMLQGLGASRQKIHVVHPAVDPGRFHPGVDRRSIRDRFGLGTSLVLLSVGRLQRRKGHDLVIEALARAPSRTGPTWHYVIAGDGQERARLERLATSLCVRDKVTFAGEISSDDLPRFYAACDVFVLPNRIDEGDLEGFGIVFLEAAATGRAVIGGRSGGVPEAVADNETGLLVSGTDVSELLTAIARLAGDPGLRRQLGDRGRRRVLESFSWDAAAAAVSRVHADVAAGK
jgi:phosphatidylinositol alpha-1,6-mannosyltransferase